MVAQLDKFPDPSLLKKHGQPFTTSKKAQVRRLFLVGQSIPKIAAALHITITSVYDHLYVLRRAGKLAASTYDPAQIATALLFRSSFITHRSSLIQQPPSVFMIQHSPLPRLRR
jgi:hypothetical protein